MSKTHNPNRINDHGYKRNDLAGIINAQYLITIQISSSIILPPQINSFFYTPRREMFIFELYIMLQGWQILPLAVKRKYFPT